MKLWNQVIDPELLNAYRDLPGTLFDAERWYADRGAGIHLRLKTTFQYRQVQDPSRVLTLNLFAPDSASTYLYYLPFLITSQAYPELQPLFSTNGACFYDAVVTSEYISFIEEMLLSNSLAIEPTGLATVAFVAGDGFKEQRLRALGSSSNTLLVVDQSYLLKNYRRVYPGQNPEFRMGSALTRLGSQTAPRLLAAFTYFPEGKTASVEYTLGLAQEKIEHGGTGWEVWGRLLQSQSSRDWDEVLRQAEALGRTLADLHREMLLVAQEEERWAVLEPAMLEARVANLRTVVQSQLTEVNPEMARAVLQKTDSMVAGFNCRRNLGKAYRIHGDLHLEQVLKTGTGWKVIDFEGEPLKTVEEREYYDSPLKDLASLLRSISYRVNTLNTAPSQQEALVHDALKQGYFQACQGLPENLLPPEPVLSELIALFELERVVYEFIYESKYRPDWVRIPLTGLEKLLANDQKEASQ